METLKKAYVAAALLVGVLLGFGAGFWYGSRGAAASFASASLVKQVEKAKALFATIADMRSVDGVITKINGNIITIQASSSTNPFDELPTTRNVIVAQNTKVILRQPKDPREFQKEVLAFQKANAERIAARTPATPGSPLLPYLENEATLKDLKVNDRITAESATNIKTLTEFKATRISFERRTPG